MFYRGIVEDNNDPLKIGRVKVRIFGIHDDVGVKTADLPWAEVSGSTEFGLISGVGVSSILRKGTMVWTFFKENDSNYPVVFATSKGNNTSKDHYNGVFKDPDGVYPKRMGSDIHPNAQESYTKLATLETACGHLIELDDTEGNERIKITHKTGSYIFIDKEGNIFINGVKNIQYDIAENATWNIGQKLLVKTGDTTTYESGGNYKVTAPRIDLN